MTLDASGSTGGLDFEWYDINNVSIGNTPTITVGSNGIFTVSVSNNQNGCVSIGEVEVFGITDSPVADAGTGTTLTCDVTSALLDASSSTGIGILTYEWLDPNDNVIAQSETTTVSQPGIYTIVVTMENGCNDQATVEIFASANVPVADAGLDDVLDCTINQIQIGGVNTSTGPNISYQWFDINNILIGTGQYLDINQSGTYTIEVTNTDNNCMITDEVIISENFDNPTVDPGPGGTLTCDLTQILLGGPGSSSGTEYNFEWQNSNTTVIGTDSTLDVSIADVYTLFIINTENGCSSQASVEVFENTLSPTSDPGLDQELTCDDPTTTLDGSNSTGPNLTFEWFDDSPTLIASTSTVNVSGTGIYTLVVTNSDNGCTDSSTVEVTNDNNIPEAIANAPGMLNCDINSLLLDGTLSTSNSGNLNYEWFNDVPVSIAQTDTTSIQAPGTYTLVVTDVVNGCTHTTSVEVLQDLNPPIADAGNNQTLTCDVTNVTLTGSAANGNNFSYEWYDDNPVLLGITENLMVSSTGTYELVVNEFRQWLYSQLVCGSGS